MIEKTNPRISVRRQCELLEVARSSCYQSRKPESAQNLALMKEMDRVHMEHPYFGSRQMTRWFRRQGRDVNRKRMQRLMRVMGIEAHYRKPNLSRAKAGQRVYPYLLGGMEVKQPNQVWATDITYIPLEGGYVYLCAVQDWQSRCILSWRLSNTLDTQFCVQALEEAMAAHGRPQIFNTDQGSQFTSEAFTTVLLEAGVKISMDGKGRCLDNVFIERFWRTLKYEEVYARSYQDMEEARRRIGAFIRFYNEQRPHSAHGIRTPREAYCSRPETKQAA